MTETLELETPAPGVLLIRLNRPKQLNAINEVMRDELALTVAAAGRDQSVHAVVITGAGRGFCSGIDIRHFGPGMLDANAPPSTGCASRRRWRVWCARSPTCRNR